MGRVDLGELLDAREDVGEAAVGVGRPAGRRRSTRRPAWVRAALTDTCWPSTTRTASSASSTVRGMRCPGAFATSARRSRIGAQRVDDGLGVGVEVEQPPAPGDRGGQVAEVVEHQLAPHMVGLRCEADDSVAGRQPQRPPVGAVAHLLDTGHRARGEVAEQALVGERRAHRQPQRQRRPRRGVVAAAESRYGRVRAAPSGVRSNTARTVSLNWRMLEKPAANATSPNGRSVVSISTRAVCARCARASASGLAPTSACSSRSSWRVV